MKLRRAIGICGLIVSSSLWAGVACGQDSAGSSRVSGVLNDASAGQSVVQNVIGRPLGLHYAPQVGFSTQLDHGPGYTGNLYTIDALFPIHLETGTNLLFLIANGSATEAGDGVANFGVGYRQYVESLHRVFGISLFADMDHGHQFDYERFGVSIESLGKHLDGRLNLYFVNDDSNVVSSQIIGSGYELNNIVLNRQSVTEHAYSGGEFELGGPLPGIGRYGMNAYTGVYYLETPGARNAYGWKVRGELLLTESVTAGINFYNDRLFGRNAFATIGVKLPDGKRPRFLRPRRVRERLVGRVVREARIPVDTLVSNTTELAINPADDAAFQVLHIDPDGAVGGDGTFESPFESMDALVNSSTADIIMVQGRDDDSGTNLSRVSGLTLLDDQRLLGAAISHSVISTQGTIALPVLSSNTPVISNSTNSALQSVVTLANNNEVSGFVIDGSNLTSTDNGMGIQGSSLVSFNINQNTLRSYTDAVSMTGVTGTGLFDNNTLTGTVGISNNGLLLTSDTAGGVLGLSLQNNTATDNGSLTPFGLAFGITAENGATINANDPTGTPSTGIIGNTGTGNGTGLALTTNTGGVINAVIEDNDFSGNTNTSTGLRATANTGAISISSFLNNTISNNRGTGVWFNANGGDITVAGFSGNTIANNDEHGVLGMADLAGTLDMQIGLTSSVFPDNSILSNGAVSGNGIQIVTAGDGIVRGAIVNNEIRSQQNGGHGISILTNPSGTVDFGDTGLSRVIQGNQFTDNTGAAVFVNSIVSGTTTSDINVTLLGNTLENNVGGVMTNQSGTNTALSSRLALAIGGAIGTEDVNGNGILDPGEDLNGDLELNQNDTNLIRNNTAFGISVATGGNALSSVLIQNNEVSGTTGTGVRFSREDSALLTADVRDNAIVSSTLNGLEFATIGAASDHPDQPSSGSPNSLILDNNIIDANLGSGAAFDVLGDSYLLVSALRNTITNNTNHGIQVQTFQNGAFGDPLTPPGSAIGTRSLFDGNTITGNQHNGVELKAIDRSRILLEITSTLADTTISNNGSLITLDALDTSDILDHPDPTEVLTLGTTGRNGIRFATNGGRSNLLINSGTGFDTVIADNGNSTLGGNGIQMIARNTVPDGTGLPTGENSTITIQSSTISGSIAEAGTLLQGDGIQLSLFEESNTQVVIGGSAALGLGNTIQSNEGDGISVSIADLASPNISIEANTIGGAALDNSQGNGGHGLNIRTDLLETQFAGLGLQAEGAIPKMQIDGNTIVRNQLTGARVLLRGAVGFRPRLTSDVDLAEFRFENGNVISSNQLEGILYEADPGRVQDVLLSFLSTQNGVPYDPALPPLSALYTALNGATFNGKAAVLNGSGLTPPRSGYMNLIAESNSMLIVTDATVQNNGLAALSGGAASDGVFVRVATNSYVAADVQDVAFGGNSLSDFRTESLLTTDATGTGIQTAPSVDRTGATDNDDIFLDDTATLDLRFNRNSGDSGISLVSNALLNPDVLKIGGTRLAELFQVDGPDATFGTLNDPNNVFMLFGSPQDVQGVFNSGGYNLRTSPDALFPNINFPPYLP